MNKKRFVIVACVAVAVGIVISSLVLGGGAEPVVSVVPPSNGDVDYYDVPLGEDFVISPEIVLKKATAPAYFEFGNVSSGATIDTWTVNGKVVIGKEQIGYVAGGALWILLYNGLDSPATFELQCINAPLDINHSDITGKDYLKAPEGFLRGVSAPTLVALQPFSCKKVPVSIELPEGLVYPEQWEFRLLVTNQEVFGPISTGLEIRFFVTMG